MWCSPALRRAGQGDFNNALKEALKSISQQTKQIAEILDATSREQTGASMEQNVQRSREAADSVASMFADRTQGVLSQAKPESGSTIFTINARHFREQHFCHAVDESSLLEAPKQLEVLCRLLPACTDSSSPSFISNMLKC